MKPNVLCVGFAKCGTTTFYDIMSQHSDIYLSKIKEPIYYGDKDLVDKRGFHWYERRYYPKNVDQKIIMEVNPIIGRDIDANIIKRDYGDDTKIIFLIRNPIQRMYSEFKMNLVDGTCFQDVEDNLGNSTREMFSCWIKDNFTKVDNQILLKDSFSTRFCESGNYYEKIKNYIDVFGSNNVKVVFFEDFINNTEETCLEIYNFMNISNGNNINYGLHSNDGNRLPKNKFTIRANQIWFLKIYKEILIKRMPFISEDFCKLLNSITWNVPILLSRANNNKELMDDYCKEIIFDYYYEMLCRLSELLNEDVFKKWHLEKKLIK